MKDEYRWKVIAMDDNRFYTECLRMIRKSAEEADPRSQYHWRLDMCWTLAESRNNRALIYIQAFHDYYSTIRRAA